MKKIFFIIVGVSLLTIVGLYFKKNSSQKDKIYASSCPTNYTECEFGNPTQCNPDGSKTGWKCNVTKNCDGSYSVKLIGYFACDKGGIYGTCGDTSQFTCTLKTPTNASDILSTETIGTGTGPCSTQGQTKQIPNGTTAYCVCGEQNGASCANTTISPTTGPSTNGTTATVAAYFEGIDQLNNNNPSHPDARKLTLYLYTTNNFSGTPATVSASLLTFQNSPDINSNQYYWISQSFPLGNTPTGSYYILAKSSEGSLRQLLLPNPITITNGVGNNIINPNIQGTVIPVLEMGDINNDNKVDGLDYNLVVECYGYNQSTGYAPPNCPINQISDTTKGIFADINDDGLINGIDYNMVLRNFGSNGY